MRPPIRGNQPASPGNSAQQSVKAGTKDYQDADETRDSEFKAIWDGEMGDLKNNSISYRDAFVLLISWDESVDDLHTDKEITSLQNLFEQKFQFKTKRKTLTKDPRRTAQAQVNRYLADFVDDHDNTNTLLIIYYAGHGRRGEFPGTLKLTGSTSLRADDDSALHEVVWGSAEHNIKDTRADVLVIFDCCHAGELEKSVRGTFSRRAFEFLAATSAHSTTKKPGKESFTSALIWSLSDLIERHETFSTQQLLRTIMHDAPDFPSSQVPRLSERMPASLRKIMLAPLARTTDSAKRATENAEVDDDEDFNEETRHDMLVRFVFNKEITNSMVKEISGHLGMLIRGGDIKAKAVLWEGINLPLSFQPKDSMVAHGVLQRWRSVVGRKRNKSLETSPTEEAPRPEASIPISTQIPKEHSPSGPPSIYESSVATPDPSRSTAEPEIGEDQGAAQRKSITQDSLRVEISDTPSANLRGRMLRSLRDTPPKNRKRGHSANNGPDSDLARKRSKSDANDESAKK